MKNFFKVIKLFFHYYWLKITKTGSKKIPQGMYCYKSLEGDNIKVCPYFYSFKEGNTGCAYCGFIGFDFGHTDLCKICDENLEYETEKEVLYHAYGHTSKGKGVVVQVMAKNGKEALDKARIEHPDCKFNHANI